MYKEANIQFFICAVVIATSVPPFRGVCLYQHQETF